MSDDTTNGATSVNEVCVWSDDGESYEIRPDYIQVGTGSGTCNKPSGLNFCPNYQLDPAQLPKAKSAKAIRDEFNAQRATNKAATKAKKDAEKKLKVEQKSAERKQKTKDKKAKALKQKIADGQRAAEQATRAVMQPETISQAVAQAMEPIEAGEDFSDLII
jgi:hypothetical protein